MWKATVKGIVAHRVRLVLSMVAVMLGVSFVAGTYVLTDTLRHSYDGLFTQTVANVDVVLIVCNDPQLAIAEALSDAAGERARKVRVLAFDGGTRHGEEPPFEICSAMAEATVIFAPTTFSLSHTEARQEATRRGIRIATMPGITEEVFRRALDVDYGELKRAGEWLAAQLSAASSCHVTAPGGTDLRIELDGRSGISDDGDLSAVGAFGNLPAGEAFIAPLETSGEGTIVFDGALGGFRDLAGLTHGRCAGLDVRSRISRRRDLRLRTEEQHVGAEETNGADENDSNRRGDLAHARRIGTSGAKVEISWGLSPTSGAAR